MEPVLRKIREDIKMLRGRFEMELDEWKVRIEEI